MEFGKLGIIYFGSLDNLDLSNSDVLDGVDGVDFSSDLLLNNFRGEKVEDLGRGRFSDLLGNDIIHAASDFLLLGAESIISLLLLVGGQTVLRDTGLRLFRQEVLGATMSQIPTIKRTFTPIKQDKFAYLKP